MYFADVWDFIYILYILWDILVLAAVHIRTQRHSTV